MNAPIENIFTAALGLSSPWKCVGVEFDKDKSRLDIGIDFDRGAKFSCPTCSSPNKPVHDTVEKEWRHLDFFEHMCFLHARVPRISCDSCGVLLVCVPWARPNIGFTLLYEALVLSMMTKMSVKSVARQWRIQDTRLWRIVHHYVDEARDRAEYYDVTSIAIDETSARKGHRYVTVVADMVQKRVVFATEGKDKKTIEQFAQDFHDHNGDPDAVRDVCMDMSPSFIEGVGECLPNAQITFDRYHVMRLANEAMDSVRREEVHLDSKLKGSRYLWLHRRENLSQKQERLLQEHLIRNERMAKAYQLVLDLRSFYEVPKENARNYLKWWYYQALLSRLESFRRLAQTIKCHIKGILNYHKSKLTNGFMEGLNGAIQTAKRIARGFRTTDNLITIIYLIAGKLELSVPT